MRSAESRECVISLSGEVIETPDIYADPEKNLENEKRVRDFVVKLEEAGYKHIGIDMQQNRSRFEYRDIPAQIIMEFLREIDVSPKNAQFNIPAVTSFIAGYRGNELKKWDIAFATGKSDTPINLGYDIGFNYPTRIFSVENDGKILKMNGTKHRIGASSDGKFGLNEAQLDQLDMLKDDKEFSQRDYFTKISRNPLLTIYFVELKTRKEGETNEDILNMVKRYEGKPVVGFGIGIPKLSDQETKYARYMLNKVAIQQIFEGEMDDYFDDDEVD